MHKNHLVRVRTTQFLWCKMPVLVMRNPQLEMCRWSCWKQVLSSKKHLEVSSPLDDDTKKCGRISGLQKCWLPTFYSGDCADVSRFFISNSTSKKGKSGYICSLITTPASYIPLPSFSCDLKWLKSRRTSCPLTNTPHFLWRRPVSLTDETTLFGNTLRLSKVLRHRQWNEPFCNLIK